MQYVPVIYENLQEKPHSRVFIGMRLSFSDHRHSHLLSDLGPELPLLALAGAVLFSTTLAVYLYAATV